MASRILIALLAMAALAAGDTSNPLDQAEVILSVRDGAWVDREATRFATAYGGDLQAVRNETARSLFRSRNLDGIDLARPSLIAWRRGIAPMIAIIPVRDRTKFLDAFGEVESGEPPLVRVSERDGTVIYTQNKKGVLWEYRLLIAANTAYVARSLDECRRLAATVGPPVADPFAAPFELTLRGASIVDPQLPGGDWLASLPALPLDADEIGAVSGFLPRIRQELAAQCSAVNITVRSDAQEGLRLGVRITTRGDSTLAAWAAQQRPGTERIAGQLRRPNTALLVCGRFTFQGQLERWAFEQAEALKAAAGPRWSDAVDVSFRSLCTLAERTGAWALALERGGNGGLVQNWVAEHPRAVEASEALADVATSLGGVPGEPLRISERAATSITRKTGSSVFVAGDRHTIRVDDLSGRGGAAAAASELLKRLDEPGSLDTAPSLLTVWTDLAQVWNAPPPPEGERAEPVVISGALRPAGPGVLEFTCTVPIRRIALLLGRIDHPQRRD